MPSRVTAQRAQETRPNHNSCPNWHCPCGQTFPNNQAMLTHMDNCAAWE